MSAQENVLIWGSSSISLKKLLKFSLNQELRPGVIYFVWVLILLFYITVAR